MLNIRNSDELFQQENRQLAKPAAPPPEFSAGNLSVAAISGDADKSRKQPAHMENSQGISGQGTADVSDVAMAPEVEHPDKNAGNQAAAPSHVLCLEPVSFGEQLRNLRAEAGMTVADVAQKVRSSQAFILNLECGDFHKIRQHDHYCRSFIERICLVYQSSPVELLDKFDQESRAAGRLSSLVEFSQQSGASGGCVFAEEDLSEEKSVSPAMHLPAILICILVGMLVVLLVSAWVMQKVRARKNVEILRVIEGDLPALITPKKLPLEVLPIPNN